MRLFCFHHAGGGGAMFNAWNKALGPGVDVVPVEILDRGRFATLRQLGATFELAALYLEWLGAHGEKELETAHFAFQDISSGAKALVLKAARAVNAKKSVDFAPMLDDMTVAWDVGMDCLKGRYR